MLKTQIKTISEIKMPSVESVEAKGVLQNVQVLLNKVVNFINTESKNLGDKNG